MLIQGMEPLVHKGPEWSVQAAADEEHGRLIVLAYNLGALPIRDRVIETRHLHRHRLRHREIFEGRARALSAHLWEAAASRGCHKVSLLTTLEHMPYFVAAGFGVEAVIDGYYQGHETGVWMGLFLDVEPAGETEAALTPLPWVDQAAGAVVIRWDEGASGQWLKAQEAAMAGPTVRTIICLAGGGKSGGAEHLGRAGYRYRGMLLRHELGQDGAQDLSVWVKSVAELG